MSKDHEDYEFDTSEYVTWESDIYRSPYTGGLTTKEREIKLLKKRLKEIEEIEEVY